MSPDEKQSEIINMFNHIAPTYDTTNRVMSMGIDVSWRKEACKQSFQILNQQNLKIADIACGTGDMILHWQHESKIANVQIDDIVGIDPSNGMLHVAKEKIPNGKFYIASADNLPLESCSQDIVSIAYGLRNVVKRKEALKEFSRVLRPQGILVILEFTAQSHTNIMSFFMQVYTKTVLPLIGGIISRNFKAYKYLPQSIDGFITRESLEEELLLHNMTTVISKSYSANVSSLIIAQKNN